jgi:hypothetical protein
LKHFLSFEVVRTALAVNLLAGPSRIGGLPLHTFSFCLKEEEKRPSHKKSFQQTGKAAADVFNDAAPSLKRMLAAVRDREILNVCEQVFPISARSGSKSLNLN